MKPRSRSCLNPDFPETTDECLRDEGSPPFLPEEIGLSFPEAARRPSQSRAARKTIPPIEASCRAKAAFGTQEYSQCLADECVVCSYRSWLLSPGGFCLHPRHLEIVARTAG